MEHSALWICSIVIAPKTVLIFSHHAAKPENRTEPYDISNVGTVPTLREELRKLNILTTTSMSKTFLKRTLLWKLRQQE